MQPLSILIASAEVAPFAKTGGLADVSGALARYLHRAGHDVRVVMPLYASVRARVEGLTPHPLLQDLAIGQGARRRHVSVSAAPLPPASAGGPAGPDVYFVRAPELYDREGIYRQDGDEHVRFGVLSEAALVVCQHLGWAPDVVHANDWHTALLPLQQQVQFGWDALFERTRTLLSIHNLGYQGVFGLDALEPLGLAGEHHLLWRQDVDEGRVNFLRTGLLYADALSTVSPTYAREIQTPEQGMGLDDLLRQRAGDLVGILNGIDADEWNPRTDPYTAANYGPDELDGKAACRRAVLDHFGLAPAGEDVPVLGIISRLTGQKGFERLPDVLTVLLQREDLRLVVVGSGEERYEQYFGWLRDTFPRHVGFFAGYDEALSHRIEAGSDLFLMPSRYEPCGLNQMYSLRYGTVPVVRRTGGLADSVVEYDPSAGTGTGFLFDEFSYHALLDAVRRALAAFREPAHRARLRANGMALDTSWDAQGPRYVELYRRLSAS